MMEGEFIKLPGQPNPGPAQKRPRNHPNQKDQENRKQHNQKRLKTLGRKDGSVRILEDLVFGTEERLLDRLTQDDDDDEECRADALLADSDSDQSDAEEEEEVSQLQPIRRAAWVDEDDQLEEEVDMMHRYRRDLIKGEAESTMSKQRLQERMKEQFQKAMGGTPKWAEINDQKTKDEDDDDEDDDLLRKTGNLVSTSDRLPSGVLRIKRCCHANSVCPSEDRLTSVRFHPSSQVVMTAGLDCRVSLFQVDGKTNPQIQSIHLQRFPVHRAEFSADGHSVIATGLNNKMFYLYDMMEGRVTPVHAVRGLNESRVKEFCVCPEGGALLLSGSSGYLHLLTLKTREVVRSMKLNGSVSGVAMSHDGTKVFAATYEGEVYLWDVGSARCVHRFFDDGCVKATSIAASPNGQYLACGSHSGVVNIYSQEACLKSANPKPLKAVMNLVTSATALTFNPTSEILAMASRFEDEAVKLLHLPSLSVFSNFPVPSSKSCYRTSCLSFSPHSGFFSLANNKGHAPLWRLLHYKDF